MQAVKKSISGQNFEVPQVAEQEPGAGAGTER